MKKLLVIALSATILVGSLVNGMTTVYANNHKDRAFSFSYYGDGSDVAIAPRLKQDNTAAYMKNNKASTHLMVFVAGTNSRDSYSGLSPIYCSEAYNIPAGDYCYMSNTVYGKYKYAYLTMGSDDKAWHTISGKWSPDNISNRY